MESGVRTAAVADELGAVAWADRQGKLWLWNSRVGVLEAVRAVESPDRVRFLVGGGSLVVATKEGRVRIVQRLRRVEVTNRSSRDIRVSGFTIRHGDRRIVPDDDVGARLAHRAEVEVASAPSVWETVRELSALPSRPVSIAAAGHDRSFLVSGADGTLALYHGTTGACRFRRHVTAGGMRRLVLADRGDAVVGASPGRLVTAKIDNPHAEVSLRTLLLPVRYEGYATPRLLWQTTGGSDAFERKLSVTPLIFGTLKATLYAMLVSVPLALLAALYVAQLAPLWLQTAVKPIVELMAAVPSVIVGFLAALWLAPRFEQVLFRVCLSVAVLPLLVMAAVVAWRLVPRRWRRLAPAGFEFVLLFAVGVVFVGGISIAADALEARFFAGDLSRWLFTEWGFRYDQRNALVVGVALGFAVIPVIFTIAEDAISSVPRSLTQAARALGATRWQTAVRMVVPAAAPGLVAAVLLGFGRAAGETMIVLMASGNTPLLDLSPLNGMRTMAAAIAVEIPEAAVGGTLYRVLFFTGLLLFAFTFVITSIADSVGRALRKRYARF
jgi:phosphate transport system permease protein